MSVTALLLLLGLQSAASDSGRVLDTAVVASPTAADSLVSVPFNLGICPGLNANGTNPGSRRNNLAVNAVMNDAGAISGVDIAGAVSMVHRDVEGMQASGAVNLAGGKVRGAQFAGAVNLVRGGLSGAQFAGSANLVLGEVRGAQFAPVNVSGNLRGAQFGMVNIADTARGLQVGLINIADSIDGVAIGLVNIARNIRVQGDLWGDESGTSHLGVVYGNRWSYMMAGGALGNPTRKLVGGYYYGFGIRAPWERHLLGLDLSSTTLIRSIDVQNDEGQRHHGHDVDWSSNQLLRLRLSGGYQIHRHLTLYAGLSYNVLLSAEAYDDERFVEPAGAYHYDPCRTVRLWPGAFFGIRI